MLVPASAWAQSARYDSIAVSNRGNPVANATIAVCTQPANVSTTPCSPLATLSTSIGTTSGGANPLTSDSFGNFHFYAKPGVYTIQIYSPQISPAFVTVDVAVGASGTTAPAILNNIVYLDGSIYPCTPAGITSAIAAAGVGGTVHGDGCVAPFVWNSTVTISNPLSFWLPCTTMYYSTEVMAVTSNGVHLYGCDGGAIGTASDQTTFGNGTPITQFTACTGLNTPFSGCPAAVGSGVDTFVIQTTNRSDGSHSRLSGFYLGNVYIEQNGVGRRGFYATTCWHCKIEHVGVDKSNGDGGVYLEADLVTDVPGTNQGASYNWQMNDVESGIVSTNTTGHPFFFDGCNGELAYGLYFNLRGSGIVNATGSGDATFYALTCNVANSGFDQNVFMTIHAQNPVANAYAFKMVAVGNYVTGTNGRIFNNTLINGQFERLGGMAASGIGIGCVNGSNTADGTGCGYINLIDPVVGNFTTSIDNANLGTGSMVLNNASNPLSSVTFQSVGSMTGPNSTSFAASNQQNASAGTQNFFGFQAQEKCHDKGFTGHGCFGLFAAPALATGAVAGNFATWEAVRADGSGIAGGTGLHVANSSAIFDGFSQNAEGAPAGAKAAFDTCQGNSTTHTLQCSYNNGTFFTQTQTVASGTAAMTTAAIAAGACGTTVTVAAANVLTTDTIDISHNTAVTAANGGVNIINAWPTAGNVNFNYCTSTANTPTAMTINWSVRRP